jgi:SpoIIAA-like
MEPAVEAMVADKGELRFVYVLGDEFDGYTAGARLEDIKLGLGHAFTKWKRIAVVTNHDWLRNVVGLFGWMVPGEIKTFPIDEEQSAVCRGRGAAPVACTSAVGRAVVLPWEVAGR